MTVAKVTILARCGASLTPGVVCDGVEDAREARATETPDLVENMTLES